MIDEDFQTRPRPGAETGTLVLEQDDRATPPECAQSCPFLRSCPFMRWGQSCPEVRTVEAECVDAGVSLWDVLLGERRAS